MNRKKSAEGESPTTKSKRRQKPDTGPEGRTIKKNAASKKSARPHRSTQKAIPKSSAGKKLAEDKHDLHTGNNSFPIVGIGASAGGLEAFTRLLQHLPADTGMGFVLVQHLDPVHESALTKLLSKATSMPVREVTNNARVEPNRVYVIPPNTSLVIAEGTLKLLPRKKTNGQHRPIDYFYQSLAEDQRERAISVILSGTASDGTLGCEAIKAEGGITFAQDDSAKYDSMPRSAIAAGCVDFVLSPEEIAKELARIARHPYVRSDLADEPVGIKDVEEGAREITEHPGRKIAGAKEDPFKRILVLLRNTKGVDFSLYKPNTIKRRIGRRLVLSKLKSLEAYLRRLKSDAKEVEALYQDMLISVTGFFRNPEAFEVLKKSVFPKLLKNRSPDSSIRVWVLGCSTGQEAYSIAMSFLEFTSRANNNVPLQVFATDLNEALLEKARAGLYTKTLVSDLSRDRLRRFFVEEDGGYRISKSIREMCVFARQNLLADPPFSRMDLISCRNLLIYLEPDSHKKILPTLHYALKPNGFIFLGASETVGANVDLFAPLDKKHRIYSKKAAAIRPPNLVLPTSRLRERIDPPRPAQIPREGSELEAQREADRITLSKYGPAGVLVNADLEILQFRGPTSRYLAPAPGRASFNLLKMAREGLLLPLRTAINKARKENQRIRQENVQIDQNGHSTIANIEVIPLKNLKERCYLILFEPTEHPRVSREDAKDKSSGKQARRSKRKVSMQAAENQAREILEMKRELAEMRDYLQSVLEEHEAANEELQASNEEVQSSNEELQSINEELETSKEELESTNEELITVNEEMQNRNRELDRANSDLNNLHNSMNVSIVLLARDLTIRRFNPQAEKDLNLMANDIGQPLSRIKTDLELPNLEALILEVIKTVRTREAELQDKAGRWYSLRLSPYLTLDNKIDGAVLTMVDIDALKRSEQEIKVARDYAEAILRKAPVPLLVLQADLRVNLANESFYTLFKTEPNETEGRMVYDLGNGQWNIPRLRQLLEEILPQSTIIHDFEVAHDFERIGLSTMLLNARRLESEPAAPGQILLSIEDITASKQAEKEREELLLAEQQARADAQSANRLKDEFLAMISHELRTPLNAIVGWSHLLKTGKLDQKTIARAIQTIDQNASMQGTIINELLDTSRIISGKLELNQQAVNLIEVINAALESVGTAAEAKRIEMVLELDFEAKLTAGDRMRLGQAVRNLLSNAVKFTPEGGRIEVRLNQTEDDIVIAVKDNGQGIAPSFLPHVFERFRQAESGERRLHEGLGLGLSIARHMVEAHGGNLRAESEGEGKGATFTIVLPLDSIARPLEDTRSPTRLHIPQATTEEGSITYDLPSDILSGLRVLFVDDQPDTRELVAFALTQYGAEIRVCSSAREALEVLSQWSPAVIISDIGLPGEDGYELMKKVRALKPQDGGNIPAAALTGYASPTDESKALAAGYQAHLSKPVELDQLVATIARLAGGSWQNSSGAEALVGEKT